LTININSIIIIIIIIIRMISNTVMNVVPVGDHVRIVEKSIFIQVKKNFQVQVIYNNSAFPISIICLRDEHGNLVTDCNICGQILEVKNNNFNIRCTTLREHFPNIDLHLYCIVNGKEFWSIPIKTFLVSFNWNTPKKFK